MAGCDCSSSEPKALKPVDEALDFLLSHAKSLTETEILPLEKALGRVLAKPVKSTVNVPPWANSAMDGYAFNFDDIQTGQTLMVSQRIPAGSAGDFLQKGTVARIFTGAPVPEGADSVIMQEMTTASDDGSSVVFNELPKAKANVRYAGEDVKIDETVLESGTRLEAQHLGLAASVGVGEVEVYRPLKVALFSSGDELVMPGEPLAAGQIYNSNQFTLTGLLQSLGCEVVNLGIVEDTFDATCDALENAAKQADLVLASGGVSVGEEDHVKPAVEKLGSLELWKIAIRPGKPLAFGFIGDTPFIGAPGNPVSLFVTFSVFARPFIKKMQGYGDDGLHPMVTQAIANFEWSRPDKRREYARAKMSINDQGQAIVDVYPSRSSGVLSSVTWANGFAVIEENRQLGNGDAINFISFSDLLK